MIRAGLISLLIAVISALPTIWAHSRGADTTLACTSVAAVAFALYFFAHAVMEHLAPADAAHPKELEGSPEGRDRRPED